MTAQQLSQYIDHTILKSDANSDDIKQLCHEAIEYNFKAVCVNPTFVKQAFELLSDTDVLVCSVIGFPLGANTTRTKVFETQNVIDLGADEIDMVVNIGHIKAAKFDLVKKDIEAVFNCVVKNNKILKVIFENSLLSDDEIKALTVICSDIGVDFIKTSTGFGSHGATLEHVSIMNKYKTENVQIKASGGIRDKESAIKMINAGATRIGTSSGILIVSD